MTYQAPCFVILMTVLQLFITCKPAGKASAQPWFKLIFTRGSEWSPSQSFGRTEVYQNGAGVPHCLGFPKVLPQYKSLRRHFGVPFGIAYFLHPGKSNIFSQALCHSLKVRFHLAGDKCRGLSEQAKCPEYMGACLQPNGELQDICTT